MGFPVFLPGLAGDTVKYYFLKIKRFGWNLQQYAVNSLYYEIFAHVQTENIHVGSSGSC